MRIHGEPLRLRCCTGDQLWSCFLTGLMFCRAGIKLFRTSFRGLLCCLGPRSMLSHHNPGSKAGKITDKIVVFHRFWLVHYGFGEKALISTSTPSKQHVIESDSIFHRLNTNDDKLLLHDAVALKVLQQTIHVKQQVNEYSLNHMLGKLFWAIYLAEATVQKGEQFQEINHLAR